MTNGKKVKILFDEVGLKTGTTYEKGQWRKIATHSETEVRGFFGNFRFLSNFWPAVVFLDGVQYSCSENAYQAAKWHKGNRLFFTTCTPREAVEYSRTHESETKNWHEKKLGVMDALLEQKFHRHLNPDLYFLLQTTRGKYLEETNWWRDIFWGVHLEDKSQVGIGENQLGKLLMKIRDGV